MIIKTTSPRQTRKFANLLGSAIMSRSPAPFFCEKWCWAKRNNLKSVISALVFALTGDLGTGKTTFVQGFLRGLKIKKKITSPTFVIIKKFQIPKSKFQANSQIRNFKNIYHIDCYRLQRAKELLKLGLREVLEDPQNIVLIEWPEKIKKFLSKKTIWIKFQHGEKENQRTIIIDS